MKNTNIRFTLRLRLTAFALLAVLISSAALAQTAAPKASLIIEQKAVRFDLQGAAHSWRLEVFNQPGDLVFANGGVNQPSLEWSLTDQQEKPLADGLYVYTLKFWDENNQQISTQRGHVIINRASSADRIWVTSNNSTGVGSASELTVVGSSDVTVGGARMAETRAAAPVRSTGDANVQQVKDPGVINAVGPISGDGIAGRIAKFTGAHTIDDSVMFELAGNIQIGGNVNLARLNSIHTNLRGVYGRSDTAAGVWGQSISGQGVYGFSTNSAGVEGSSINGFGLSGVSSSDYGVYGTTGSASFAGVFGTTAANNGRGVFGRALNGASAVGVFGESADGRGVFGDSQTGTGVRGESNSGSGVYGSGNTGRGVFGNSQSNHGVYGRSLSNTHAGVYGTNLLGTNGIGVMGEAQGGSNQNSIGVYGLAGGTGVRGESISGHGVAGYGSFLGASIYGAKGAAWAGYFDGDVVVDGTLTVNNNFGARMDHPIDPANKYLNQSFIESSEMMSVQNGNVTTDTNGEAVVTLPEYFQAMSGSFRYQLTVVGQFAQAIIAQKIEGNRFTIRTDKPNVEVSWQVTGVRQDAVAKANRKPAEELKPESERGHYLRPQLFNQPEEKGIEWARNPEMMKRMKAERQTQVKEQK
ncbi:MAG: gliding motility-associated C-terminal domain-containing protein [Acidobacteria bacterium]|nr:gliding motility-associated C-terminal domain-containing protein [Acidobacteriota bacterium]